MRLHFLNCLVLVIVMIVAQTLGEIFPKRSINEPNFPESVDAFFDNGSEEDLEDNFSNLRYLPSLEKPALDKRSTEFNSMKLLKRSKLRKNNILNFKSDNIKSSRLLRRNKRHLVDGNNKKIVNYLKELEQLLSKKRNTHKNQKNRKKKDCLPEGKPVEFKIKKQRKPLLTNLPYDAPMMTLNRPFPIECPTLKPVKATPPSTIPPTTTPIPRWPKTTTIKTTPCPPATPITTTEYSTKFTTVHSTASFKETTNELITKMETTTEPYNKVIWPESLDKTVVESEREIRELERQKAALKRKFHQEKRFIGVRELETNRHKLKSTMDDISSLQNRLEMQNTKSRKAESSIQNVLLENMYGKSTTEKHREVFHFDQFEPTEIQQPIKPSSTEHHQPVKPSSKPVAHHQNKEIKSFDDSKATKHTILHLSSTDFANDDIEFLSQDTTDLLDTDIFQALHNLDTHLSKKTTTASNTYSKKKHRGKRKATFSDLPIHHFAVAPIDISSNENFNYKTDSLNRNFLKFPVKKLYKKSTNSAKETFYMRPDNKLNKINEFRKKNSVHYKRKIPKNMHATFHEESKDDKDPTTKIFDVNEDLEYSESAEATNGEINTEILTEATEVNNESINLSPIYVNLPTNPPNVSIDDGSIENYYLQQLYPTSKEAIVVSTVAATEEPESLSPEREITTENSDSVNEINENVIRHTNNKLQMANHSNKNVIHKHGSAGKKLSAVQNYFPEHQNEKENESDEKDSIIKERHEHETEEQSQTELTEHETDEQTEESGQEIEGNIECKEQDNLENETEEQAEHETEECEQEAVTEEAKSLLEAIKQKLAETNQQEANEDAEHLLAELKEQLEIYALHHNLTTTEEADYEETTEETEQETTENLVHETKELDMEENTEEHITQKHLNICKTKENTEHEIDEQIETEEYEHETEETTSYTEQTEHTTLMNNSDDIVGHDNETVKVENQIIAAEEISNEINQDHEFEVPQSEYDNSKESEQKEASEHHEPDDDDDEDESDQQTEETESQGLANPKLDSKDNDEQTPEATSESKREPNLPRIEHQSKEHQKVNIGLYEPKKHKQYVDKKAAHERKVLPVKYHPHREVGEYKHKQLIEDAQHQKAEYLHKDRNVESKDLEDNETEFPKNNNMDATNEKSEWIVKKTRHKNKHTTTEEAEWLIKEIKHQISAFEHMKHEHHDESEHKTEKDEDDTDENEQENTEEHVDQTTEEHIETHTEHETDKHVHEITEEAKILLEEIKDKLAETDQQETDENAHHLLEEIKEKLEEYDHHLTTTKEVENEVTTKETEHETHEQEHSHETEENTEETEKNAEEHEHETTEDVDQLIKEALEKNVEYQHHLHLTTTEHGETTDYELETEEHTENHNHETVEDAEEEMNKSELHNNDSITTEHETKELEDEDLSKQIERVYGINVTEEVTHENEDLKQTTIENLPEVETQTTEHGFEESTHETTVEADLMLEHIELELEEYLAHKNKTQKSSENQAKPNKEAEETSEEHPTESVTTEETQPTVFAEKSTTEEQVLHKETVATIEEIAESTTKEQVTHEETVATTKEITESTIEEQVIHKETVATTQETEEEATHEKTLATTKETTITIAKEQPITSKENTEPIEDITEPVEKITEEIPEYTIDTTFEKSTSESIKTTVKEENKAISQTSEDLYNELSITNKAIKLSKNCNLEDYLAKNHCICSIKHVLEDLFDDINKINSTENYNYICRNFIHIDPGIIISNKSESKILRKRKTREFIETYVWKREARVGRDIDGFLRQNLTIPNGNVTYVNVGSKVVIPCTDDLNPSEPKENINYLWTIENGSPETTGDRPNNGSSLVISSASPQDSDNYTCTIEDRSSHQITFHVHHLSVVSLPGYNLIVTVHLNASSTCQPGDMEVLNLYYPVAIKDLLCSGEAERVCNIMVEKPQCIRLGSEDIISLHATLSTEPLLNILPRLNTKTCNLSCQSRVYSIIVSILLKNLASVTNLPVFFRLSYRQAELTPTQYQKGDKTNMVSNSIMTICPPGFGIYDNQKLCLACEAYTFNPGNQMKCTPCPRGSYQPAIGSRMCLPCNSPLDDSSCFLPGAIANISRKYYIIPIVTLMAILLVIGCCCCAQRKSFKERVGKMEDKYNIDMVQKGLSENLAKNKSSKSFNKRKSSVKSKDGNILRSKSNTRTKDETKLKNELHKNESSNHIRKMRQKGNNFDSEKIEIVVSKPTPRKKTPPEPPPIDF